MSNYYTRIFSRSNSYGQPIGQQQFEQAQSNLSLFDCCIKLGSLGSFSYLQNVLGWSGEIAHVNRTKLNILMLAKYVKRGEIKLLWRRFYYPRRTIGEEFTTLFNKNNLWNYRLLKGLDS